PKRRSVLSVFSAAGDRVPIPWPGGQSDHGSYRRRWHRLASGVSSAHVLRILQSDRLAAEAITTGNVACHMATKPTHHEREDCWKNFAVKQRNLELTLEVSCMIIIR